MKILKTYPGDSHFHLFQQVIETVYPSNMHRPESAESVNTDFLEECVVVLDDEIPVARAALYHNPHLLYEGSTTCSIGYYESINNEVISKSMFSTLIESARNLGAVYVIGPMNGSTWNDYRFSTHHNYPNFLLEPFHPLYYNNQFVSVGFLPISRYTSSKDTSLVYNQPSILEKETTLKKLGVNFRGINLNDFENELEKLYPFLLKAFEKNFLYTPISREAFFEKYRKASKLLDNDFVEVAVDSSGNLIGFVFSYRNFLNTSEMELVIKTLARDPSKQWSGLGLVLANRIVGKAKNLGFTSIIHAFMIEEATSTATSQNFMGNVYKNYVLYGLKL